MIEIRNCPSSLRDGFDTYSPKAAKSLFGTTKVNPTLGFDIDEFRNVGEIAEAMRRISVSGVQEKSVIIFDEVQKCPNARQAIKYLVEDGRYDYIETGSLLSIKQNVKGIIIPSEEDELTLNPLDYEEFKWALGDEVSIPMLYQFFEKRKGVGDEANRNLMRDFRLYMLVGGMPQAVKTYA